MNVDFCNLILSDFIEHSWSCIEVLTKKLTQFNEEDRKPVSLFRLVNGRREDSLFDGKHFFLRGSIEYSNPQLTVEEIQGIIATRLLEVCADYSCQYGLHEPDVKAVDQICEMLKKPPQGRIIPFLLVTDDVEPDRYSINPLRKSIVYSGQSAFPVATVVTDCLEIDSGFVEKYDGALISKEEINLISSYLKTKVSYLDMVDSVKYAQMEELSQTFGVDLSLFSLRMPLAILQAEKGDGLLNHVVSEVHQSYESIKQAYACMRRSLKKRTTLLTIPHSTKGYGSKKAARGKLYFEGENLDRIDIQYKKTRLYPNELDPDDVSIAKAEGASIIPGESLSNYNFEETPSSPQFFLYSLGSPEDAAVWHGIGEFASSKLLRSCASLRIACRKHGFLELSKEKYGFKTEFPLQFNLTPERMWVHPIHKNIDASVGSVRTFPRLARMGMRIEHLSKF